MIDTRTLTNDEYRRHRLAKRGILEVDVPESSLFPRCPKCGERSNMAGAHYFCNTHRIYRGGINLSNEAGFTFDEEPVYPGDNKKLYMPYEMNVLEAVKMAVRRFKGEAGDGTFISSNFWAAWRTLIWADATILNDDRVKEMLAGCARVEHRDTDYYRLKPE